MSDPQQALAEDDLAQRFEDALQAKMTSLLGSVRVALDTDGRELVRSLVEDAYRGVVHPGLTVETLPLSEADRADRIWRFQVSWPAPVVISCTLTADAPEGAPE